MIYLKTYRFIALILVFAVFFNIVVFADVPPATEYVDFSYMIEGESSANQVIVPEYRNIAEYGVKWDTSYSLTSEQIEEAAAEAAAREAAIAAGEEVGQAKYASSSINGMSGSALQAASSMLALGGVYLDVNQNIDLLQDELMSPCSWLDVAGFYLDEQGVIDFDNSHNYYPIDVNGTKITGVAQSEQSKFYNFSVESLGRIFSHLYDVFNSGVADGSIKLNNVIARDGSTVASNITGSEFYSFVNQMSAVDYSSYSSFPSFISSGLKNSTDMYIINCTSYSNGWYNVYDYVPSTYFLFGDYSAFYQDLNSSEVSRSTVNGVNYDYFLLKDSFSYIFDSSRSYNLFGHFQIPSNGEIVTSSHDIHEISSVYHFRISDNTSLAKDKKGEVTIGDTTVHYNPDPDKNIFENPDYINDLTDYLEQTGYNIPQTDNHPEEVGVEVDNVTGCVKIVDLSTLYPDEEINNPVADEEPVVNPSTYDLASLIAKLFAMFAPVINFFKNFVGDFSKLDTSHLNIQGLEYIFPFCIPLDVYKMVTLFDVSFWLLVSLLIFDISPLFDGLPVDTSSAHIVIDMQEYETPIEVFRYFSLAIFIAAILRSTRELIKG